MPKILSRAGITLADLYDIKGSQAPVNDLLSEDVHLSHEMGSTIFGERFSGVLTVLSTGAIAQSTAFDVALPNPPRFTSRILGISVLANNAGRTSRAQVSVATALNDQDQILWSWETGAGNDVARGIRAVGFGVGASTFSQLVPGDAQLTPQFQIGTEQPFEVASLHFRGNSSGFGAGTVILEATIFQGFPSLRGVSSKGLPIPSW